MTTVELTKPLRRDAAENRARLLDAATQVFAEHGLDGSVEDVAREAGVGMGTLYRRFPTKQALIDELVGGLRRDLLELAHSAAERTDGTGLEELLLRVGQFQAEPRGCLERLWRHSAAELDTMTEFRLILRELLASAQELGRIRSDVMTTDISMVLWSLRGVIETTRAVAPTAWRRHLEILVAGLRPASGPFAGELVEKPLSDARARRITRADQD
jgi:AcrR family transcriptional regulator